MKAIKTVTTKPSSAAVKESLSFLEKSINSFEEIGDMIEEANENESENAFLQQLSTTNNELNNSWLKFWEIELDEEVNEDSNDDTDEEHCLQKYYMPTFWQNLRRMLPHISLWSNLLNSKLGHDSQPMTNSPAEMYFKLKKSDKNNLHLPLGEYIKRNQQFRIALQRQFVDRFCDNVFEKRKLGISKNILPQLETMFMSPYLKTNTIKQDHDSLSSCKSGANDDSSDENDDSDEILTENWTPKGTPQVKPRQATFLKPPLKRLQFCNDDRRPTLKGRRQNSKKQSSTEKICLEESDGEDIVDRYIRSVDTKEVKEGKINKKVERKVNKQQTKVPTKKQSKLDFKPIEPERKHDQLDEMSVAFLAYRNSVLSNKSQHRDYFQDPVKMKETIKEQWKSMTSKAQKKYLVNTPLARTGKTFCICNQKYHYFTETSSMVACDTCNNWFRTSCIGIDASFAHVVPYFVYKICITKVFYVFLPYIRYHTQDLSEDESIVDLSFIYDAYKQLDSKTKKNLQNHNVSVIL